MDVNRFAAREEGGQFVTRGLERPGEPRPRPDPPPLGEVVVPPIGYNSGGSQVSSVPLSPASYGQPWQVPSYGQPTVNQSSYQEPYSQASAQNAYGSPQGQGYAYPPSGQGGYYAPQNSGNTGYVNYSLQSPVANPGPPYQDYYQGQSHNPQHPPFTHSQSTPDYTYEQHIDPPPRIFSAPPERCRRIGQPNHDPIR